MYWILLPLTQWTGLYFMKMMAVSLKFDKKAIFLLNYETNSHWLFSCVMQRSCKEPFGYHVPDRCICFVLLYHKLPIHKWYQFCLYLLGFFYPSWSHLAYFIASFLPWWKGPKQSFVLMCIFNFAIFWVRIFWLLSKFIKHCSFL